MFQRPSWRLRALEKIKDYILPSDEVYCLGDCADRGNDGFKIMQEVLAAPNITYIKGNHEDLLVNAYKGSGHSLWMYNGGAPTESSIEEKLTAEEKEEFISTLRNLPTRVDLDTKAGHIVLTHAGCHPWLDNTDFLYIWDRGHINDYWSSKEKWKKTYVVHGHTPTPIFDVWDGVVDEIPSERDPKIITYADGHKICIDTGAVWTGVAAMLNLDTLQPIYFEVEDKGVT